MTAAPPAARSGFNEAGAVMPRKLHRLAGDVGSLVASMRPGLLCPGRRAQVAIERIADMLQ